MAKFGDYVMFAVAIGAACFIFFLMAKDVYRFYLSSGYWNEAKGVILAIDAEARGNSSTNTFGHQSHDSFFVAKPTYEYWVGSERFVGESYQKGMISTFKSREEVMSLFSVGEEVVVYYNPENPNEAVLSKEQKKSSFLGFGLFGLALLIVAFVLGRRIF